MSKFRTKREAYKQDKSIFTLNKNAEGQTLCRHCKSEVKPPRRTLCSKVCAHEWAVRTSARYARACVIRRDRKKGKLLCAMCKLDCLALRKQLRELPNDERYEKAAELGIPKHRVGKCLFDIDHIIPVAEGGGECSLDNLRVLCLSCHKKVTKELRARLIKK